jgi:transmembrane sensor
MQQINYKDFTVREFLDDMDFLRYIKYQNTADVFFWENWKAENPEKKGLVEVAELQMRIILSPPSIFPAQGLEDVLWAEIQASIAKLKASEKMKKRRLFYGVSMAAAMFIIVLGFWFFNSNVVIRTGFGEMKTVRLPDSTKIILNSNSSVSYPRSYSFQRIRKVEVAGEAYFKVRHLAVANNKPGFGDVFIASTKNFEVKVLGTEFNIWDRREKSRVSLINGSIEINSIVTGEKRKITPGEFAEADKHGNLIIARSVSGQASSWRDGKLLVNQASVKEILTAFEDLYGYRVILDDPALANKKIDGSISIKSEQGLLFTLSQILDVNVKKEGKTIFLIKRK